MNKRNKPASLTSSLLARKGEAEPAIEPYSFPGSGDGRADGAASGNDADLSEGNRATSGITENGTAGGTTPTGPDPVVPADSGFAAAMGDRGGATPDTFEDRESVRDRRLLRFVYATAVLTGVLAIVIYAGGWFFGDGAGRPQGKSRVIVMKQPPAQLEPQDRKAPKEEPKIPSQLSAPPKPPAPPVTKQAETPKSQSKPPPASSDGSQPKDIAGSQSPTTKAVAAESKIEARPKSAETKPAPVSPAVIPKAPSPASKKTIVATRATETPAPTASGRYYVQLASVPKASSAKNLWSRLQKKFPDILGEYDLTVQKRVIAKKGTFYRVQVGRFATFKDVRALCDLLKARKQPCLPVKR